MLSLVALEFFQKSPLLLFPLVALGLFMFVFVFITLRTVLTDHSRYDALSRLPLESSPHSVNKEVSRE